MNVVIRSARCFVLACVHVETVVQLSRKKLDDIIHVDLDLTDLPLTKAEANATYQQIKAYVLEHTGLTVSNLYISQVKRNAVWRLEIAMTSQKMKKPSSRNVRRIKKQPLWRR